MLRWLGFALCGFVSSFAGSEKSFGPLRVGKVQIGLERSFAFSIENVPIGDVTSCHKCGISRLNRIKIRLPHSRQPNLVFLGAVCRYDKNRAIPRHIFFERFKKNRTIMRGEQCDPNYSKEFSFIGWRLSGVLNNVLKDGALSDFEFPHSRSTKSDICSGLSYAYLPSYGDSIVRCLNSLSSFGESSPKEVDADGRRYEHPKRSKRHPLLRAEIAILALLGLVGGFIISNWGMAWRSEQRRHWWSQAIGDFAAILGGLCVVLGAYVLLILFYAAK